MFAVFLAFSSKCNQLWRVQVADIYLIIIIGIQLNYTKYYAL